jgi:hypothetical protein
MATPESTTPERRPAPEPRLSPMARRVTANKQDGRRLVDEVPSGGIRPAVPA